MSGAETPPRIPRGLRARLSELYPGSRPVGLQPLGPDASGDRAGATAKGRGVGVPMLVRLALASGQELQLTWHVASSDDFGHDRRSDRVQEHLLAFDTSRQIRCHERAVDVGAIRRDGRLRTSISGSALLATALAARGSDPGFGQAASEPASEPSPLDVRRDPMSETAHHLPRGGRHG